MVILTLNCGSSSAKFQGYDWDKKEVLGVRHGRKNRSGNVKHRTPNLSKNPNSKTKKPVLSHKEAIEWIISTILDPKVGCIKDMSEIKAVGHRVLHGGEAFKKSVIIDDDVLETFKGLFHFGPLHMPANIMGIEAAQQVLPDVTHCAVMDTAWHQTMPNYAFMYALPYDWYTKHNVRRYGFHGTSYVYTAKRASVLLGKDPHKTNVIICHIGNGASMCAVKDGKCYDTSMGLTPLEGLIMGTRSGDMDPAIVPFIMENENISPKEMDAILNKTKRHPRYHRKVCRPPGHSGRL